VVTWSACGAVADGLAAVPARAGTAIAESIIARLAAGSNARIPLDRKIMV